MYLTVTEEHIKNGLPRQPCWCPVALAMKDIGYKKVSVCPSGITILDATPPTQFDTSFKLEEAIRDYDHAGVFKAGRYEIKERHTLRKA